VQKVIVMSCVFYTYVCAAFCVINDVLRDWFTVWVIIIRLQRAPTTRHTDFLTYFRPGYRPIAMYAEGW